MKILLLGEFSGLYKNLKEGLLELGHSVVLSANGDSWKKVGGADYKLYNNYNILEKIKPLISKKKFEGYDVVQFVSPVLFYPLINEIILKHIIKNNDKSFLTVGGDHYQIYKLYKEKKFMYYMYDNDDSFDRKFGNSFKGTLRKHNDLVVAEKVDGIIPIAYEYAESYRKNKKMTKAIQIPINIDKVEYTPNVVNDRIVIFHGLNRENVKGTQYIREAFRIIKDRYGDEVDLIIDGKMPLDKYLHVINRANIVVDQCKSYGWGVNAVYSLAQGKIVLSGAEAESLKEFGLKSSPIINIRPDVNHIVENLEMLIQCKKDFEKKGYESRKYVETYHNYIKIAQEYIDTWRQF